MKFFTLPTPAELGRTDGEALPSREWSPETTDYTWEDYEEELARRFPVRWNIRRFGRWLRRTWYRLDMAWFGLVSRFWLKQHLLDYRKCGDQDYRGGYIDACDAMPIAMFGILKSFVEECGVVQQTEELEAHLREASPDSLDDEDRLMLSRSLDSKKEMVTLYQWWVEGRKEEERQLGQILTLLDEKPISKNEYKRRLEAYGKKEREISETQMQMMLRLVRVHPSLWE